MKSVWSGEPQAGELAVPKQHGAAGQAVTTGQGNFSSMEAWAVTGILHGPEIKCKTVECLGSLVSDSLIAVHHINCDQLQSRNLVRCKLAVGGVSVASLDKFAEYFPELWRASHKCQTMGSAAPACSTFDVRRSTFDVQLKVPTAAKLEVACAIILNMLSRLCHVDWTCSAASKATRRFESFEGL